MGWFLKVVFKGGFGVVFWLFGGFWVVFWCVCLVFFVCCLGFRVVVFCA